MNEIKIECGIPAPTGRESGKQEVLRQAFRKMKSGDSFLWTCPRSVYRTAQLMGIKVRTRKLNGEGYRVWRIS